MIIPLRFFKDNLVDAVGKMPKIRQKSFNILKKLEKQCRSIPKAFFPLTILADFKHPYGIRILNVTINLCGDTGNVRGCY